MSRRRQESIFWSLVFGLGLISLAWLFEFVMFTDLGAHSTNSQAFDVIKIAVAEGKFSGLSSENEIHNAALRVANDASRAVMSSVRRIRSMAAWAYAAGGFMLIAALISLARTPKAQHSTRGD